MEVLVFYSSCKKKKKKWYLVLLFCTAHTVTFSEMVCSNWSQPECLDFRIRSCWNVVRVVLSRPISSRTSFFSPRLKGVGCYLTVFLVPCILVRTLFSSGLLALPAIGNVHLKQKKKPCSSIFKQRGGLSQHGSVFHPCNMPHSQKKKVMGNQADSCLSGELELILELHYSGQQQAGKGWVEWGPWERYACVNGWKNTGLALAQLAQLTSTRLNLYGLGETSARLFASLRWRLTSGVPLLLLTPQMDVIL